MITLPNIQSDMIANNLQISNPVHPGEVIKDEMDFLGMSQKRLAEATGISYTVISELIHCKRQVTVEYAMLFEAVLNLEAEMLLNMQMRFNKSVVMQNQSFIDRLKAARSHAASVAL